MNAQEHTLIYLSDRVESYRESDGGGGLFSSDSTVHNMRYKERLVSAGIEARGRSVLYSGGEQRFEGAEMASGKGMELSGRKISILARETASYSSHQSSSESLMWQSSEARGHDQSKVNETRIAGPLVMKAEEGIEVEANSGGISQSWMRELAGRRDVRLRTVVARDEAWDEESSGLTGAGAAIVSIAAGAATFGTASGVAASMTAGMSGAAGAAANAAIIAGITGAAGKASVALVNNKLDPIGAARDVAKPSVLRSLARGVMIAGLTAGISSASGFGDTGQLAGGSRAGVRFADAAQEPDST